MAVDVKGGEREGGPAPGRQVVSARLDGPRELAACAQSLAQTVVTDDPDGLGLLAALPHLVYWKDAGGCYLGANPAYRRARELPGLDGLIGRTEDDLPVRDAFTMTLPSIESSVVSSGVAVTGVQTLNRADRQDATKVLLTVVPLRTEEGRVTGVLGVGADVTGLSDLDAKVSHASKLESIGRLAANIAHQINTPVQFITDNTRFVADGVANALRALQEMRAVVLDPRAAADADRLEKLRRVIQAADVDFLDEELPSALLQSLEGLSQIAQIVSSLSDFSRPEGAMAPADLNHAVDNAVHLTLQEWTEVGDLRLDLDPDAGSILCYEGELRQVLLNLISNAAQAIAGRRETDPDAPAGLIEIATHRLADTVVVTVRDNGCGMDEAVRARIFDPFFTTRPLGQATGQGLSLAYTTVVGHHGGDIEVSTEPGRGTMFTVTLPVSPPADLVGEAARP
ncbi:MAG TPA: ATP-binding protein [Kineosporiaceae bacterium]|nr:ATP-binding protein [Kineosporiaceae bacterium]